jgi:hypothetical protein
VVEDTTTRPRIHIDLRSEKQSHDLETLLAKIRVDRQFVLELMTNPAHCLQKHGLDLPQGVIELITQRGRPRDRGPRKGLRIASLFGRGLFRGQDRPIATRRTYQKPRIFSVEFCTEIYNKTMVNFEVFLSLFSRDDAFITYSYDPATLIPVEVPLPQFLETTPKVKYGAYWIEDHQTVLHPFSRILYKLNAVGAAICEAYDGRRSVARLLQSLQAQYDAEPQRIQEDLVEFTTLLTGIDLLEV